MKTRTLLSMLLFLATAPAQAREAPTISLPFRGELTNIDGTPVDGFVDVTLRIHDL